jgi:hypothetical protein
MIQYYTIAQRIIDLIGEEWVKQGHELTGAFRKGMSFEIEGETINIYDNTDRGYGKILEQGVPSERIPFSPRSGARTSKYIQGLARYAQARMGADDKTALSIAFAIAYNHKKEGMPTEASKRFSSTGRRVGFVEDSEKFIDQFLEQEVYKQLEPILQL